MFRLRKALLAAVTAALACTDGTTGPGPTQTPRPSLAQGDNDLSRAHLIWADLVNVAPSGLPADWHPSGIQGDDRDRLGIAGGTPSDEYQGRFCGVAAFIWNARPSQDGSLNIDPDAEYAFAMSSSCGLPRTFRFLLNGPGGSPTDVGAHITVTGIWKLAAGASVLQSQVVGMQNAINSCQLRFDDAFPPANHIRVTRLANVGSARQWRVESQGSHRASCTVLDKRGRPVATGVSHYLPFSVTVTEVPPPAPSFP